MRKVALGEVVLVAPGPWVMPCPVPPTVEKIRATFTMLRAFGSVSTGHSHSATRFTMVMSLDFSATGRVTAAQLQVRPLGERQRGRLGAVVSLAPLSRAQASRGDPGLHLNGHGCPRHSHLLSTRKSPPRASRPACASGYDGDEIFMNKHIIQPLNSWS